MKALNPVAVHPGVDAALVLGEAGPAPGAIILAGGDTAATDYFRGKTAEPLAKKFLPIVKKTTARVGLAEKYNAIAGKGSQLGLSAAT